MTRWLLSTHHIPTGNRQTTVSGVDLYHAVDELRRVFSDLEPESPPHFPAITLAEVVCLHNEDGIKHVPQIRSMIAAITQGDDILEPTKIPNIKLVQSVTGEWVLIDGHHTFLAYMASGKKQLQEVPFLVIQRADGDGRLTDSDINVVFGHHASRVTDWRTTAINWQAAEADQLAVKRQRNMGQLFEVIRTFVQ